MKATIATIKSMVRALILTQMAANTAVSGRMACSMAKVTSSMLSKHTSERVSGPKVSSSNGFRTNMKNELRSFLIF